MTDKTLYDYIFSDIKRPKTIIKNQSGVYYDSDYNLINSKTALDISKNYRKLILKPSIDSGGGKDIIFLEKDKEKNYKKEITKAFNTLENDFVVQEIVRQHKSIDIIHPSSVNTIRTMSFLHNNEVYILSSVLRMGVNSSQTDNSSGGGLSCGIDSNNRLNEFAYDKYGEKYEIHPSGITFKGRYIPGHENVISTIKKTHKQFGHFKLISWDFAIGKDEEPILIEFNKGRININFHQMNQGPLFGNLTTEVLTEVFGEV